MSVDESLKSKASRFRALHAGSDTFVLPCAWDALSARMFESLGFSCVGTTSDGVNWSQGRQDYVYAVSREHMLSAYGDIARATALPVSGDLENGYGDTTEDVQITIRESIAQGMAGGSIEDKMMDGSDTLYPVADAEKRIRAARTAADECGIAYTLTARCEVYYTDHKKPYAEAVERLNQYREAGADCLFVPGANDLDSLTRLVADVDGPISFGMGASDNPLTVQQLTDIGIRRVSTGGRLARFAFNQVMKAASTIRSDGTFNYLSESISEAELHELLPRV